MVIIKSYETENNNVIRIIELDVLKGVAILLVVIGHAIQYNPNITNYHQNIIFNIIYSFHMPLFMIISGYLAWKHTDNKPLSYLGRKFINLIIPFASWYIVCYGLIRIMNIVKLGFYQNIGIIDYLVRAVLTPSYGLWYLWVLFFNLCILYIALRFEKLGGPIPPICISMILLYLSPMDYFGLNLIRWYWPFFAAGYIINRYSKDLGRWKYSAYILSIIIAITSFIVWTSGYTVIPIDLANRFFSCHITNKGVVSQLVRYVVGFAGIGITVLLVKILIIRSSILQRTLSWLGTVTLDLYVNTSLILILLSQFPISCLLRFGELGVYLGIILMACIAILISLIISFFILRRFDILALLFLGKYNSKKKTENNSVSDSIVVTKTPIK